MHTTHNQDRGADLQLMLRVRRVGLLIALIAGSVSPEQSERLRCVSSVSDLRISMIQARPTCLFEPTSSVAAQGTEWRVRSTTNFCLSDHKGWHMGTAQQR